MRQVEHTIRDILETIARVESKIAGKSWRRSMRLRRVSRNKEMPTRAKEAPCST
jgi:hypothetical protein